jgi:hypothetical protein
MKYANECKTYGSFLKAGAAMRDVIAKHLKKDNSLPDDLVSELAITHAAHYGCSVEQNKDGAWKFKDAQGERHAAAQMQWGRTIDPHHKRARSSRGGARESLRKDPVAELLNAFYDLTAKQRAEFLARAK